MTPEEKIESQKQTKLLRDIKTKLKREEKKSGNFYASKQKKGITLKKAPRATYVIKQVEQEPYKSIYFKREYEQDKRNFFFK